MPKYNKKELKEAVEKSSTYAETLRKLGMCQTGSNYPTLKKYLSLWRIETTHFSTASERAKKHLNKPPKSLEEILIKNSHHNRTDLKKRLYVEKLKQPVCEICGQNEFWRGKKISLILDHKNGIRNDNRLKNLRILCPNCNATLETHCGKQAKNKCAGCSNLKPLKRKYCSIDCYRKNGKRELMLDRRKVTRPTFQVLMKELNQTNYTAVGKKYGVSDNAIRKWVKTFEKYVE